MTPIVAAESAYRSSLQAMLGEEFQPEDYRARRRKMEGGPFPFLRATYWRWCDYPLGFEDERPVLAVGDIHAENFGTWRDVEGRLVFGVNDFDEAARMPWPHDLVRLLASLVLGAEAQRKSIAPREIAGLLLGGYRAGLTTRAPIILDGGGTLWSRLVLTRSADHEAFWTREEARATQHATPLPRYLDALLGALPPGAQAGPAYARKAGTGSLGRPRFATIAQFRGGRALREAKRMLPSAWSVAHDAQPRNFTREAAFGPTRSPEHWLDLAGDVVVRRLSPNNRKIEFPDGKTGRRPLPPAPLDPEVLAAMGHDLGAIHGAVPADAEAILAALDTGRSRRRWLTTAAETLAEQVRADHKAWRARARATITE